MQKRAHCDDASAENNGEIECEHPSIYPHLGYFYPKSHPKTAESAFEIRVITRRLSLNLNITPGVMFKFGYHRPMPTTQQRLIFVDDLEVWVIGKPRIRNMNLRVQPPDARIEVSVPRSRFHSPFVDAEIADFIRNKRAWLDKAVENTLSSPMSQAAAATPEQVKYWRQVVEAFTPALVEQWEPILGVKAKKLDYRNMRSRWGSCQPSTGRICINVRLALYPPECLEYVVVHELCHLLVSGHGPDFHQLMTRVMPDWKQRRAKLR